MMFAGLALGALIAVAAVNIYDRMANPNANGGDLPVLAVADAGVSAVRAAGGGGEVAVVVPHEVWDASEEVADVAVDSGSTVAVVPEQHDAGAKVVVAPEEHDAGTKVAVVPEEHDAGAKLAVAPEEHDAGVKVAVAPAVPDAGTKAVVVAPTGAGDFDRLINDAKLAVQKSRWGTAVGAYRKALALNSGSAEAREGLGIALVMSETGFKEAIPYLQEAVKNDPQNPQAWLALGLALQNTNREHEAKAPYNEYLKLKPNGETANEIRAALQLIK
jgi:Flp pilus assembly protein TadD